MVGIPPALDTDVEDVVWALQTAASLWKRDERVDAIVWLRRAAQAAGEAEHDDRAFQLARVAAELSEWIAHNQLPAVHPSGQFGAVSSVPPHESGGVDDLLRDIPIEEAPQVSMSAMTEPHAFMPVKVPAPSESGVAVFQSVTEERSSERVQSAAEVHAGMLDPWSAPPPEEPPPPPPQIVSPESSVVSSDEYDDEVVTSARLEIPAAEPAVVLTVPNAPAAPHAPPPLPKKHVEEKARAPHDEPDEPTLIGEPSPALRLAATPDPVIRELMAKFPVEHTLVSAGVVPEEKKSDVVPTLDLATVDALADLPDDARAELERVAELHVLAREEEVMGFALAFVLDGEIDVAGQIVDVAAERIQKGKVLKAKGTIADAVPLRLICASDHARVATWTAEQVEPAFKACPWVDDDLRASANRMQALVGVTLGPLADRLDSTLRAQVTDKLEVRELAEGDVIVEDGQPIRELCLVGQGAVELVRDGAVIGEVSVGEFLFPAEIIAGGKASATARAGKGGTLVLVSDRSVAQELMSTCPPLLEIFAGM